MDNLKLIEARQNKGMSVDDVSKALGISRQGYYYFERGQRLPRVDLAIKIASVLNVKVEDIF